MIAYVVKGNAWVRVGTATRNEDGSITLTLSVPVFGQVLIREEAGQ